MSANTLSKSRDQVIFQIAILALLLLGLIHDKGIRRIQGASDGRPASGCASERRRCGQQDIPEQCRSLPANCMASAGLRHSDQRSPAYQLIPHPAAQNL
jgi:hypothetical protein